MKSTLRVMTLNLGGGIKNFSGTLETNVNRSEALLALIRQIKPDLLCVQEIAQYVDGDGIKHSMVDLIREGAQFSHAYYGETLSMKRHMQVRKDLMVEGLFKDWWDWSKGNAVFSRIRQMAKGLAATGLIVISPAAEPSRKLKHKRARQSAFLSSLEGSALSQILFTSYCLCS